MLPDHAWVKETSIKVQDRSLDFNVMEYKKIFLCNADIKDDIVFQSGINLIIPNGAKFVFVLQFSLDFLIKNLHFLLYSLIK